MASVRVSPAGSVAAPPAAQAPASALKKGLKPALVVLGLAGMAAGVAALSSFESRVLTLDGVELPRQGDPEPFVRELAAQWHETEITLDAGSRVVRATRRELGGHLDVDATVAQARLGRGSGPIWSRVWAVVTRRDGSLGWRREVHEDETRAFVDELRNRATVAADPGRHDGRGARSGATLNVIGATSAIADALRTDTVFVRLPVRRLAPPTETPRDRRDADFTEVVSAHETRFAYLEELVGRARNIELAARFLDGATIPPRGELSFNEAVGERSFERGFAPAIELTRGGRRTEGIGGGVCQVAATLHAAAFFGGFDILEHHPHTRNSSYIAAGLDSAVSWPSKDLRIRNPYPFHVRVRVGSHRGHLRIELLGARRAPRVEWNTRVVSRQRRGVEREVDPNLPLGSEEIVDEGEDGMVMERTRTVFWTDGAITDTEMLRYPVVHELVRGGPQSVRESASRTVSSPPAGAP